MESIGSGVSLESISEYRPLLADDVCPSESPEAIYLLTGYCIRVQRRLN